MWTGSIKQRSEQRQRQCPYNRHQAALASPSNDRRPLRRSLHISFFQACIAGYGYFLVGNYNQICAKPKHPVLFLSAPGIDFNAGAASRAEMQKYFFAGGPPSPSGVRTGRAWAAVSVCVSSAPIISGLRRSAFSSRAQWGREGVSGRVGVWACVGGWVSE